MSGIEKGKKYLKPFKDGKDEKPVDWEMYLIAVLHRESANYQPVTRGPHSSVGSQTACKQQERYSLENDTTALQQLFTKRNAAPGNFYGTVQVNVIGDQEREITSIDYLLGVGAKYAVEQIERQEWHKKSFENDFVVSLKGRRRGAICKEIEKELKINGKSLRELRKRLVFCYSSYHYSLM